MWADAGAGNDLVVVAIGTVCVAAGGDGIDLVTFTGEFAHGMRIDMSNGGRACGLGPGIRLSGFEAIGFNGTLWTDVIRGGSGSNTMSGGPGADVIIGGPSADWITASRGADTITGGGGRDRFFVDDFDQLGAGDRSDVITDFTQGEDLLDLMLISLPGSQWRDAQ